MEKEGKVKALFLMSLDTLIIVNSYILAFIIRFNFDFIMDKRNELILFLPVIVIIYLMMLSIFKMYKSIWTIVGIDEVAFGLIACLIATGIILITSTIISSIYYIDYIDYITVLLAGLFIMIFTIGIRVSFRIYRRMISHGRVLLNSSNISNLEKILIIGAGSCGQLIIEEVRKQNPIKQKVIGVIDDNPSKIGTYLRGIKILGNRNKIIAISEEKNVDLILIAMPSVDGKVKKEIIEICQSTRAKVKIIPGMYELIGGKVSLNRMRDIDLRDLLGREEVILDKQGIKDYIENKVVMVTGGGGSIGSELCRQIAKFSPKLLLILDIYENNAYELENEIISNFKNLKEKVLIASVREEKRLENIFNEYKPQVIFHAAAHKHVPLMERNPEEAIKNNVIGTLNVAECAHKYGAERFVLISTDKAVNPTNVMGASKRMCEMIIQAIDKNSNTEFVAVRFGNVLGSNGSVIPLFKKQIAKGGPVTLTHKKITRYFMLIPEAAQLVLQAGAYAKGGEIFVLDMGNPVLIYDLAKDLIKLSGFEPEVDIKIEITGLRPGEKLYEELLMDEEGLRKTSHEKIFIAKPGEYDFEMLKLGVNALKKIADLGDVETLKTALQFIVKTYKRLDTENNSVFNEVALHEASEAI
ncbi:polysaccharide biosynthesis protein [Clostridium perfringens]|uniref:Polysaccharide biosynthesis protein n=2 Tax=Clostridium perfringens TaxID=1502 RepID=A0AAP6WRS6_CLOPF|nr:nucleoside-diphosphate sugar epimerase/dehydratase [Clostridium perfringens]EDT25085.1 capsular polysaccharide biosynthesis protein [Clostridium perfringens B str. ATCC 3626]ELC8398787.1 polysaccharide biosynthesis protein [Clostridium perfringens]MDU7548927.1 nucleoside-diphosphate sugar epimerase/dehydratase [Clostridium perfringens]MDZ5015582.1 NAD-dependent epimerase/dehydratase family protein [Clostridium perfringens]NGU31667.1 polysaccharide biosynthesis protein [Clostridium perfringe